MVNIGRRFKPQLLPRASNVSTRVLPNLIIIWLWSQIRSNISWSRAIGMCLCDLCWVTIAHVFKLFDKRICCFWRLGASSDGHICAAQPGERHSVCWVHPGSVSFKVIISRARVPCQAHGPQERGHGVSQAAERSWDRLFLRSQEKSVEAPSKTAVHEIRSSRSQARPILGDTAAITPAEPWWAAAAAAAAAGRQKLHRLNACSPCHCQCMQYN